MKTVVVDREHLHGDQDQDRQEDRDLQEDLERHQEGDILLLEDNIGHQGLHLREEIDREHHQDIEIDNLVLPAEREDTKDEDLEAQEVMIANHTTENTEDERMIFPKMYLKIN